MDRLDPNYSETLLQIKRSLWPSIFLNACFAIFAFNVYPNSTVLVFLCVVNSLLGFSHYLIHPSSKFYNKAILFSYVFLRSSLWSLLGYWGLTLAPNNASIFLVTSMIIGVIFRALSILSKTASLAIVYALFSLSGMIFFALKSASTDNLWHFALPIGLLVGLIFQLVFTDKKRNLNEEKLQKKLVDERSLLRSILKGFPGKLSVFDSDLRYIRVNELLTDELGTHEILGEKLGFTNKSDRFVDIIEAFNSSEEQQKVLEAQLMTTLGLRWHYISLQKNEANGQVVCITLDIEHQKEIELERQNSNRLSALGEMCSNIAHEINNPLTVIATKANLLKRKVPSSPESLNLHEGLQQIEDNSHRIAKIIKSLQVASRNSENDPSVELELEVIFKDVTTLCDEKMARNEVKFSIELPQNQQLKVVCKPTQMVQVLLNLVNNSFDAIHESAMKWIKISAIEVGDIVEIRVTDSGSGIAENVLEKMMQPFFTTKPPGKGTGLGLALSKKLIEKQSGRLYFNPKSANTEFVIEIPKVKEIASLAS